MDLQIGDKAEGTFAFSSSIADDIWHAGKPSKAYEMWYFDALSDDGNEAVTITFLDNFVYSPRYNKIPSRTSATDTRRFPAIGFTYFRNGKVLYRTMLEFPENAFDAGVTEPFVKIGQNSVVYRSASYGSGYHIQIDAALRSGRRVRANFEWLAIESDLFPGKNAEGNPKHLWNMVAPRCDVTGKVAVSDRRGRDSEVFQFRGTGYHDHKTDDRWLAKTVHDWHWGRAHFADATAVFYRYRENGVDASSTRLMLVCEAELTQRKVALEEQNYVRNKFGIKYPTRLRLISEDDVRLTVKPLKIIESSFYGMRFLSEMTLTLRDGAAHATTGITEFVMPAALKYRWLNWLSDIRTGKNGRGPRL
jgi:carotenoid 1,2-hydratase